MTPEQLAQEYARCQSNTPYEGQAADFLAGWAARQSEVDEARDAAIDAAAEISEHYMDHNGHNQGHFIAPLIRVLKRKK